LLNLEGVGIPPPPHIRWIMTKLKTALHIIDNTSLWVGKVASFLIVVAMCLLLYEVVARYAFDAPTKWAHEISRHFYGIQFMLGGAFGLLMGYHVVSDVIVGRLSPRTRAVVDMIFSTIFFFYCYALIVRGTEMAIESVRLLETTQTIFGSPVWPVKVAIPLGGVLIFMQGAVKFIRDMYLAVTGERLT